jgi:hypothetical protein
MRYHRLARLHRESSIVYFRVEAEYEVFCQESVVQAGASEWWFRMLVPMVVQSGRDFLMRMDSHMSCSCSIQRSHISDQADVEVTKGSFGCQIKPGDGVLQYRLTSPRIVPGSNVHAIGWPGKINLSLSIKSSMPTMFKRMKSRQT